ncbi:helix-turn-helix transcriptional regulator [Pusillimonas minor]|uniref:Helix-turn-helix transcriptional regulator n=1 Tax=Pusillimonas minor TaxID=2697024 RepID=A0A842HTU7_9BURK|nr:helix-turn-helix transcriptional regulator [Pusillimonas minor]MBC2771058.1 helix-turn-helix transcriptional regulator [Pusillimonas minor]
MTTDKHFLGDVLARLRTVKHSDIKQISHASGVPESTVRKLYYGEVANPRVQTVQALHDYFSREDLDKQLKVADH